MGQTLPFICPHCRLSASVSGGELQDAVCAVLLPDESWPPLRVRCKADATHPVRLWTQDAPCPRCG